MTRATLAQEIENLPEIPEAPPLDYPPADYMDLQTEEIIALRARLVVAERGVREYIAAVDDLRQANMDYLHMNPLEMAMVDKLHDDHANALADLRLLLPVLKA